MTVSSLLAIVVSFQTADTKAFPSRVRRLLRSSGSGSEPAREKFVEPAFGIEFEKVVATADMRAVDENLRHGVPTRSFRHGLPVRRIRLDVDLVPLQPLLLEELLRAIAEGAPTRRVEEDLGCNVAVSIVRPSRRDRPTRLRRKRTFCRSGQGRSSRATVP